ncbi:MAG: ROK family protein [Acetanaerobacterium sp.]
MYKVGIDLGGTTTKIAFVADNIGIVQKTSITTRCDMGYRQVFSDIAQCINEIAQKLNIHNDGLDSIGLATPGLLSEDGSEIVFASNLGFEHVDAIGELKKYFDCRVAMGNDANAAALGEHHFGAGKGSHSSVTITIGTGIGSGIIINDKLVCGCFNSGAEIGHHIIVADGELCPCGQRGCMELYASASAIIRFAKEEVQSSSNTLMLSLSDGDLNKLNAKVVYDAYYKGDKSAARVVGKFIKYLGIGVINIINILQPEVIIIGGGVSGEKEKLITPLSKYVKEHLIFGEKNFKTKINFAILGSDAGVIGAAML